MGEPIDLSEILKLLNLTGLDNFGIRQELLRLHPCSNQLVDHVIETAMHSARKMADEESTINEGEEPNERSCSYPPAFIASLLAPYGVSRKMVDRRIHRLVFEQRIEKRKRPRKTRRGSIRTLVLGKRPLPGSNFKLWLHVLANPQLNPYCNECAMVHNLLIQQEWKDTPGGWLNDLRQTDIARELGLEVKTVRHCIELLAQAGYCEVTGATRSLKVRLIPNWKEKFAECWQAANWHYVATVIRWRKLAQPPSEQQLNSLTIYERRRMLKKVQKHGLILLQAEEFFRGYFEKYLPLTLLKAHVKNGHSAPKSNVKTGHQAPKYRLKTRAKNYNDFEPLQKPLNNIYIEPSVSRTNNKLFDRSQTARADKLIAREKPNMPAGVAEPQAVNNIPPAEALRAHAPVNMGTRAALALDAEEVLAKIIGRGTYGSLEARLASAEAQEEAEAAESMCFED